MDVCNLACLSGCSFVVQSAFQLSVVLMFGHSMPLILGLGPYAHLVDYSVARLSVNHAFFSVIHMFGRLLSGSSDSSAFPGAVPLFFH